jgi:hypothetical protein
MRLRADQSGVAMITAMLAIFILTIMVAALTLATMGETGLSFDQSRSAQALQLAEAGAYRALAELRVRISWVLDANIRNADPLTIRGYCTSNEGWRVIATWGGPGWVDDASNRRAYLQVGTQAAPIEVRDAAGSVLGSFYATIYVRPVVSNPGPGPNTCINVGVESYQMRFDYFIVSTEVTRNATRTVCLKNPGNVANCGAWLASDEPDDDVWDSAPASHGWLVLIEKASYSRWALMLLNTADTWLTSTASFLGPVHSNTRFRIWGNPTFASSVVQVAPNVTFGNGGRPILLAADTNPPKDVPSYLTTRMELGAAAVSPPANNSPWWAVLGDDPARSGTPSPLNIRSRTTQLLNNTSAVPSGIYFMDECANPACGGIYAQGGVNNMVLGIESNKQTIIITQAAASQSRKFILDSPTNTRVCTGPPAYATCTNLGKGFNGMIFVKGGIQRTSGNPNTGLYGTVQQDTRLTIAGDGVIQITDHLVYQAPPNGPDDTIGNVLGLYSWCSTAPTCTNRNIEIDGALAPNNLFIDASVLAPWGQFRVMGWDTLPDKGTLRFLGGAVQADFGPWGGFRTDAFGNIIGYTGYGREMTFDQRFMTNNAPPFFPLTDRYTAPRYPRLNPDPLYDRPLWEELLGP